jgi:hypothetical protein
MIIYHGVGVIQGTDFSPHTIEGRRKEHNIFQVLKESNYQPRILFPVKTSLKSEGEIEVF